MRELVGKVDCIMCGHCCGYRMEKDFGGVSYAEDEIIPDGIKTEKTEYGFTIPVNEDDVCIYLIKLNNGFTRCGVYDKRPNMCKLFYCLTQQKGRQLQKIVDELWQHPQ
jgi:Fe-S-cluster containining protein